ncbi:WG repeat-containing protein [Rhodohalobacter sp. 614A]|uniref:WG repeat-containing protein n=1 Tax=Rhodohalobacter sp. 614A TaxID=2908649 RepID=UPI001F44984E|nr:WG repeat-containing protein [Rhodohalobacter sp. 614A]
MGTDFIETKDKAMIVNTNFDEIINCKISTKFSICSNFYNGIAVYTDGEKYGYISRSGQIISECKYEYAERFKYGVALASTNRGNNKFEYLNRNGELILTTTPKEYPIQFRNNLGLVQIKKRLGFGYYFTCDGEVYNSDSIFT